MTIFFIIFICLVRESFSSSDLSSLIFKKFNDYKLQWLNILFCNSYWLEDISGLLSDLKRHHILGQPFITKDLIPILRNHYEMNIRASKKVFRKPLVITFQGPVGVGKSFVANILLGSTFFLNKHFLSNLDYSDPDNVHFYKTELNDLIDSSVKACPRSLFIFDDVDSMPKGIFDSLSAFKPTNANINYGDSLFIFISQSGSHQIMAITSKLMKSGKYRDDFNLHDFESSILSAFNEGGGCAGFSCLYQPLLNLIPFMGFTNDPVTTKKTRGALMESTLVKENTIDAYIPFLPFGKHEVERCIFAELYNLQLDPSQNQQIILDALNQIHFEGGPENLFSSSGCKLVLSKLHMAMTYEKRVHFWDKSEL